MFAADAVYGNSIDLELEVIAKKGVARKAWLLMLVNVLLPAFTPVMVRRGCSSFKRRYACTYTRGSVRRASGFVLTLDVVFIDVQAGSSAKEMLYLLRAFNPLVWFQVMNWLVGSCSSI